MNDLDALLSEIETSPEAVQVHLLQDLLANPDMLRLPAVVLPRIAYAGRLTMLAAAEKSGKSTAIGQGAAALCTGSAFLGEPTVPSGVLWIGLDEPPSDVVRRLAHHGATEGVALFFERPTFEQIEETTEEHFVRLVVVDTITEFADGLVENANLPEQWTPILRRFRQIAQRTSAGIVLLHHTNRATGKYRGSGQLGAGVDVILEMTESESDPTVRKVKARGRVPVSDFTIRYTAGRYDLESGELSLQMRVYRAIEASPGISQRKLRDVVEARMDDVKEAVRGLLLSRAIENRGGDTRGATAAYHARPAQTGGRGPGNGWETPPEDSQVIAGHERKHPGNTQGSTVFPTPLKGGSGETVAEGGACNLCNTSYRRTVHRVWRCPKCCPDNRWMEAA